MTNSWPSCQSKESSNRSLAALLLGMVRYTTQQPSRRTSLNLRNTFPSSLNDYAIQASSISFEDDWILCRKCLLWNRLISSTVLDSVLAKSSKTTSWRESRDTYLRSTYQRNSEILCCSWRSQTNGFYKYHNGRPTNLRWAFPMKRARPIPSPNSLSWPTFSTQAKSSSKAWLNPRPEQSYDDSEP